MISGEIKDLWSRIPVAVKKDNKIYSVKEKEKNLTPENFFAKEN